MTAAWYGCTRPPHHLASYGNATYSQCH